MRYLLSIILSLFLASSALAQDIKNTDLAGNWYPANPQILSKQINDYLQKAKTAQAEGRILAIISPHAGLQYSGPVAAYGFKLAQKQKIDTVVIVGFSHRKDYDAIAVFNQDGIKTPLGILYTDKDLVKKLKNTNKKILEQPDAFEAENSIELILPFIQVALGNPKIVLLAMGNQSLENCQILSASLYEVLKDQSNFLIVASTDMSHYLPYQEAKKVDADTTRRIKEMQPEKLFLACYGQNRMCGLGAVSAVMIAAKKLGANETGILQALNSTDTTGLRGRDAVVGYLSAALVKKINQPENKKMDQMFNEEQRKKLLNIARDAINLYVSSGKTLEAKETDPSLIQSMGAFVTLTKKSDLRGCIGNLIVKSPLYLTIRDMAIAAASEDPRFNPVTKDELADIHIEISVLSPLKKIVNPDEIIMGKHGVLVKDIFRSGVYLPQVATETGWTKEQFMSSLCASKAGISPDAWKTGKCEIYVFTAEAFGE